MPQGSSIFTQVVQVGHEHPAEGSRPAAPSIVPAVGFTHPTMDETLAALGDDHAGYVYSRAGGPTHTLLEEAIAALEGAEDALSFSSGMAAIHATLLAMIPPNGRVLAATRSYGMTRTLLLWLAETTSISVQFVEFLSLQAVESAIEEFAPHLLICEGLTNPLARVTEIDRLAELAHAAGARLIVDNTFATPFVSLPLSLGADVVVHSTTKFLNGHGDVLGGVAAGPLETIDQARIYRKMLGATPSPFDAWLTLRGVRTLALRMQQACRSAQHLVDYLANEPRIKRVWYAGLPADLGHVVAGRLFRPNCFGAMLAFEIDGADQATTFRFMEHLQVIRTVPSLGDVNSTILHPSTASHRQLTDEEQAALGIMPGTLRISTGIESPQDLVADLAQALARI